MTRSRDVAYIRKLCGLPLPPQALAQTLLPALRVLIPSHSGGVFWVDEQGEMTNLFAERLLHPDAMATYYERHYQTAREGFVTSFRRRAGNPDPVSFHSFTRSEQSSDYFRDVLRPLDAYHILYGILHLNHRPVAQISLYRGVADGAFDTGDCTTLRSLLHYLAGGLGRPAPATDADDPSVVVEEELGIAAMDGTTVCASEPWLRLLRLLAVGTVSPRAARGERAAIDQFLRDACARLSRVDGSARMLPELTRDTPSGRFFVRAFHLKDAQGRRTDQLGLLIRREEPRSVALVRGTGASDLSPQQREVALLLAQGRTNREIADALGLSLNTSSYHVKQVYARLGVNERSAVVAKLMELARDG